MGVSHESLRSRSLNTWDAISLTIGSMVGAGIFTILAVTVKTAGPAAALAWILVVVMSLPMVYAFGDLAGALAESGGPYVYLRDHTKPWIGYWVAWSFLLSAVGAAGALFIAFVGMLRQLGLGHASWVGLAVLLCLSVIVAMGIHVGARLQRVLTVLTLVLLLTTAVIGFAHARWLPDASLRTAAQVAHGAIGPELRKWWNVVAPHGGWTILLATFFAFWTYSGWEAVAVPSGSYVRRTSLSNGMIIGSIIVGAVYALVAFSSVLSLPSAELASHVNPLVAVAALSGSVPAVLVGWGALFVVLGSLLSWIIASSALLHSMIRDGVFPAPKSVRAYRGEYPPFIPVLVALLIALIGALPGFSEVIAASSMTALFPYATVFAAVAADGDAAWEGVVRSVRKRRMLATAAFFVSVALIFFSGWSNIWPTLVLLAVGGGLILVRRSHLREATSWTTSPVDSSIAPHEL